MNARSSPEIKLKPPFEVAFSGDLKVRYGFRDAHVEIDAKVPFLPLGRFRKSFPREDFKLGKAAFDKAKMWKDVPEFQRHRDAPPQPFVERLGDRIEMRYGFADAHAELVIRIVDEPGEKSGLAGKFLGAITKKLPSEFKSTFSAEEIESAQGAFSKADAWSNLSDEERAKLCL